MLLDEKEKHFIFTSLTLAINCPARNYSNKLYCGRPTAEELLDMQIFLNQISEHCHERWMFRRLHEDYKARTGSSPPACLPDPDPALNYPRPEPWLKKAARKFKYWFYTTEELMQKRKENKT